MNDKQHRIIDLILNNLGKTNEELFELHKRNGTREQFEKLLKDMGLDSPIERTNLHWSLQIAVEKVIYENPGRDNPEVAEIVVEEWNKEGRIPLTSQLVISFLTPLQFKFTNTQKAFLAICDGDLESYKAYLKNQPKLFVELYIRYGMCAAHRMGDVVDVAKPLLSKIFGSAYDRNELFETLKRLDFLLRKDGRINYRKMTAYNRVVGMNNLVFAEGMKSILSKYVSVLESEVGSKLEYFLSNEENDEHNEPESINEEEGLATISGAAAEPIVPVSEEPVVSTEPDKQASGKLQTAEEEQQEPQEESVETKLIHALSTIGDIVEQAKQAAGVKQEEASSGQISEQYVKTLEEENQRLKIALEQEQNKVSLAEEKAIVQILTTIAGKNSNYLLSDLFDESEGNLPENRMISRGRLVNLFSALTLLGIEPYTHSYEKDQIFKIHKDELIKNFMIDSSISTKEDFITVQLTRYGWTLNGKIIIQPLVVEVKED